MKLRTMTYIDSDGVKHIEWFGSKADAVKRRGELRDRLRDAKTTGFAYDEQEVDVPKEKAALIAFLTSLTGNGGPVFAKGKISVVTARAAEPLPRAA